MAVGDAFTLTTPDQADDIRAIERFIGQKVPQLKLEGFNYYAPPPRPAGQLGYAGAGPQQTGQRFAPQRPSHGGQHRGNSPRPVHPNQRDRPAPSTSSRGAPSPADASRQAKFFPDPGATRNSAVCLAGRGLVANICFPSYGFHQAIIASLFLPAIFVVALLARLNAADAPAAAPVPTAQRCRSLPEFKTIFEQITAKR